MECTPMECISCKKTVPDDDYEVYAVFRCRKDHIFKCCKIECLRMFEKKCMKVSDNLVRVQHKLNNDGHTSALRRLPPSEREKLKQYAEAESLDCMICPEEVKASERSVPHCAHCMELVGGYGQDFPHGLPSESSNTEPPVDATEDRPEEPRELLDYDMLQVIVREEDDDRKDQTPQQAQKPKKKKNQKQSTNKKGQALLIDWKTTASSSFESEPAPKPQPKNPGGIGAAQQAWSAVAAGSQVPQGGNQVPQGVRKEEMPSAVGGLRGGSSISSAVVERRAELGERALQDSGESHMGQAELIKARQAQGLAPSLPAPPPPLPEGWQAVWSEDHGREYYWHVPSNETAWERPIPKETDSRSARNASDQSLIARVQGETRLRQEAAIALLESNGWDADAALRSHSKMAEADYRRKQDEDYARRKEEERRRTQEQRRLAEADRRRIEDEHAARMAANRRAQDEAALAARRQAELAAAAAANRCPVGHSLCTRHFRPTDDLDTCLSVTQGDQLTVTWTDLKQSGWAYGARIDSPSQEGFFPQEIVRVHVRSSRRIRVGDVFQTVEPYECPPDCSGYLSLNLGDLATVLYVGEEPNVWVYCEKKTNTATAEPERGWVPETSLDEYPIKSKPVQILTRLKPAS